MADKDPKDAQTPTSSDPPTEKSPEKSGEVTPAASAPAEAPAEKKSVELKIEQPPAVAPSTETPASEAAATETPTVEEKKETPSIKFEGDDLPHAGAPADDDSEVEEEEEEKSGKLFWIIAAILFVLILVVGAAAWYSNSKGKSITDILLYRSESEETEIEEEESEELEAPAEVPEEEAEIIEFTGDFLTAELPDDWTITEYTDGDGSTMLSEGTTYVGLTGLTISNGSGDVVFTLESIFGIGGISACEEYYQFDDSSTAYYQQIVDNSALNDVIPVIVEVGADEYTESELFGVRVRRSGYTLYWDTTTTLVSFDAACGMSMTLMTLPELSFTGDGDTIDNYQNTLEIASEEDLVLLDAVLESLAVI